MRLDHLLSKEEVGAVLLFGCEGVSAPRGVAPRSRLSRLCISHKSGPWKPASRAAFMPDAHLRKHREDFRWRYARGQHPYPSRTRWLSPGRPMVLYWGRYGRAGGCRRIGGLAQLGEHLPCKQGVESSNLLVSTAAGSRREKPHLENRILKDIYSRKKSIMKNYACRKR